MSSDLNNSSISFLACAGILGALLMATLPAPAQSPTMKPIAKVVRQVIKPFDFTR